MVGKVLLYGLGATVIYGGYRFWKLYDEADKALNQPDEKYWEYLANCLKTGRQCIGCKMSVDSFERAMKRYMKALRDRGIEEKKIQAFAKKVRCDLADGKATLGDLQKYMQDIDPRLKERKDELYQQRRAFTQWRPA